jgi:hypothetical protein
MDFSKLIRSEEFLKTSFMFITNNLVIKREEIN